MTPLKRLDELPGEKNMRKARARAYQKRTPMAAIRAYCIECVGGELAEVRRCTVAACFLLPFRMGRKDPELLKKWEAVADSGDSEQQEHLPSFHHIDELASIASDSDEAVDEHLSDDLMPLLSQSEHSDLNRIGTELRAHCACDDMTSGDSKNWETVSNEPR